MMPRRLPALRRAAGVVALGASMLACGGGTDRLTTAEFVTRANAVCQKAEERSNAVEAKLDEQFGDDAQTGEELQTAVRAVTPIIDDTYEQLGELRPPKDLEADFERVLGEGRQASADLKEAARSPDEIASYIKGERNPADAIDRHFGELGLAGCKG